MENLLKGLNLPAFLTLEELPKCKICNLDEDKILIITPIEKLNEIPYISNKLPSLRQSIMNKMNNPQNKEHVQSERIPMSKFLWDMYIIALHKIDNSRDKYKIEEVAKYERDRFIARKMIIEYESKSDLQEKFNKLIFPERILNSFSISEQDKEFSKINYDDIENLLNDIEKILEEV